jgi:crotonobetainyl-CoA:carnitine CoA-transferase CaiB-like acyl-CoA transferase
MMTWLLASVPMTPRPPVAAAGPSQPLAGIRVLDLTTNMSGPLATMVLADQGADVIKVEPITGDVIRSVGTGRGGMSAYFANLNRAKRSIALDLASPAGRDLVERIATDVDVFVQNFRTGVIDRLGLGADVLTAANPRLVYASISGFGTEGPMATAPAYDHVVQALSGVAALQSDGDQPAMVRHGVVDKATAYAAAQAICAALVARSVSGRGSRIDLSMLDVSVAFLWPDAMMNHTCDEPDEVLPPVSRSFRLTPTADGHISLVTLTGAQWHRLVDAILGDHADGADRPDLSDTGARMAGGAAVMRQVRATIAELPTAEVLARLTAADVACAGRGARRGPCPAPGGGLGDGARLRSRRAGADPPGPSGTTLRRGAAAAAAVGAPHRRAHRRDPAGGRPRRRRDRRAARHRHGGLTERPPPSPSDLTATSARFGP